MSTGMRIIAVVSAAMGIAVIVTSSLVLNDAISYNYQVWQWQHSTYIRGGENVLYEKLKFDQDILMILTPLTILVGLIQAGFPMWSCCVSTKKLKRMMQIWIAVCSVLIFLSLTCFVLGMVYQVDTLGNQTYHYNGRYTKTYLSSWWKYDKGQAYLGVLGIDVIVLIAILIWLIRWIRNPENIPPHTYSYGNTRSPSPNNSKAGLVRNYHDTIPRTPSPLLAGQSQNYPSYPYAQQQRTPSPQQMQPQHYGGNGSGYNYGQQQQQQASRYYREQEQERFPAIQKYSVSPRTSSPLVESYDAPPRSHSPKHYRPQNGVGWTPV